MSTRRGEQRGCVPSLFRDSENIGYPVPRVSRARTQTESTDATLHNMSIRPEEISLHLSRIDTSAGEWLIAVDSAAKTQGSDVIILELIMEQDIDEEHFRTRELGVKMSVSELDSPELFEGILIRLRRWVEATEGDGFLDLTRSSG